MKIAIIGASGKAGSEILSEAVARGHEVTAIVRDASKINTDNVAVIEKDLFDLNSQDVAAFDVVVNAFGAPQGQEQLHVDAGRVLIQAFEGAPNTRLIVVGGAGSLFVDEAQTIRLIDTPEFPEIYKATASSQGKNLEELQKTSGIQWTFVSPAAFFNPEGKRTGTYQIGKDNLLVNSKGESHVSYADYAIAILDEIETPKHVKSRFTLVSESE
ncbi:NAD(P)-dependent oxidoreductase [Paenibacillus pini]|uniref:Rrf2-linked NADH-flavin reductase n=1 Tax=Paenibacillus pini JCM 16418 TaxID=1236976 RepID=W7YL29_9BACL|nr:NAD(P)-dependent oxidoreductase [Paenibacillus pini]GAF09222.1 Rrf2-linked NADH-flavin reductase [Paenibacillus pini JCM 16418]